MAGFQAEIGTVQQESGFGYDGRHFTQSYLDSITATPSGTQSNSITLNSMVNRVTTVATAADAVRLKAIASFIGGSLVVAVINAGANTLNVWPQLGDAINSLGANNAFAVPPGGVAVFYSTVAGKWYTALSASGGAQQAYNAVSTVAATINLTGAQITGGSAEVTLDLTGSQAGAVTLNLPTVAALVTAMTAAGLNPQPGMTYELDIIGRDASNTYTVTTATGWTLTGTMTVLHQERRFYVTLSSLTAAVLQSIGTITIGAS